MNRLTREIVLVSVVTLVCEGGYPFWAAANQSVAPAVPLVEPQEHEITEVGLQGPPIERIRITADMLMPEDKTLPNALFLDADQEKGLWQKLRRLLFLGWLGDFKKWLAAEPKAKLNEKETRLRDEWETLLGHDYFRYYYKYKEAEEAVRNKTSFDVYDFKGKANYEFRKKQFNLTFERKF